MNGRLFAAFKEGLATLGWKEGSQVVIEERCADGRSDRLLVLAGELAAKGPAVIGRAGRPQNVSFVVGRLWHRGLRPTEFGG